MIAYRPPRLESFELGPPPSPHGWRTRALIGIGLLSALAGIAAAVLTLT